MNDVTVTTPDKQMGIQRNGGSWWVLTMRVHTDPDLLDQLKLALDADYVSLCEGGYNFMVAFRHYSPKMPANEILAVSSSVVTAFYADPTPFVVARNTGHDRLDCLCPTIEFTLSRRFEQATREDIEQALCRLPGVASTSFYYGGNRLWVRLPSHLFDIDETAVAVIQVVTDYGKTFRRR